MKLSGCFQIKQKDPSMELKVTVYNINTGFHESLKSSCTVLGEYAEYTSRVRAYTREMDLEEAVERAITECIKEGMLTKSSKNSPTSSGSEMNCKRNLNGSGGRREIGIPR